MYINLQLQGDVLANPVSCKGRREHGHKTSSVEQRQTSRDSTGSIYSEDKEQSLKEIMIKILQDWASLGSGIGRYTPKLSIPQTQGGGFLVKRKNNSVKDESLVVFIL
jgi:hypothetical protein